MPEFPIFGRRFSTRPTRSVDEGISFQENLSIPSGFRLMDISKDKKFMAVIDNNFELQVYGIECNGDGIRAINHRIRNVRCTIDCRNALFVFLSVASETGYVAISFAQLKQSTGLFCKGLHDSNYMKCRIYKGNGNDATHIPLQGRAVFIGDKLALVGNHELTILDAKTFKLQYFLDLSELKQTYEAMIGAENLWKNTAWADYYPLPESNAGSPKSRDGDILISLTRHIKNNILVTTYRGYITKIWSILDGSLIGSFKTVKGECIMAISEDNQFTATYNHISKKVLVYCTKSALPLHEYVPECMEKTEQNANKEDSATVNFIKFSKSQHYLIIVGTKDNSSNATNSLTTLFFEVWSMSQQKRLICREQKTNLNEKAIIPFVMESDSIDESLKEEYKDRYYTTQFNGVFMKSETIRSPDRENTENAEVGITVIKLFPLFDQEPAKFIDRYVWSAYPISRLSKDKLRLRGKFDEIATTLDNKDKLVTFRIKNGDDKLILRFGLNMIQLWKLKEIAENDKCSENEIFNFRPMRTVKKSTRSQVPIPEQEDQVEDTGKYYNTMENSTLLYIRSFKGHNYLPLFTFRQDWEIEIDKNNKKPKVSFMEEKGRMMITIKYKDQTMKDEIFLPIPNLEQETPITSSNSRTNDADSLNSTSTIVYHEIESLSQALHYLYFSIKKYAETQQSDDESKAIRLGTILFNKTKELLENLIFTTNVTKYFNTISGSKTLAMLASFPQGQCIIWRITTTSIPMNIFSYAVERKKSENLFTVLIQESKYDLFEFLFNQTIINYYNEGTGNLSAFIDVLLCLQDENSSARLLSCIQRLSYLPVKFKKSPLLESEYYKMHTDTPAEEDEASSLEYLDNFNALEQINKYYYNNWISELWSYLLFIRRNSWYKDDDEENEDKTDIKESPKQSAKQYMKKAQVCLVPLPFFNSYRIYPEKSLMEDLTRNHRNSLFTRTALSDFENNIFKQGYTVMEVLVSYKWKAFAKTRFNIILGLQLAYYVSVAIGISSADEFFDYKPGDPIRNHGQIFFLILALLIGLILLGQEIRQMMVVRWSYLKSIYNYLDLASFIFPLTTFLLLVHDSDGLYEVSSISILILWIHFILRLRVYRPVGYLLEMVIQLSIQIVPVTAVMILVVLAFTHSFFILLRSRNDLFIEEQDGDDDGDGNVFSNIISAFFTVWFFIFGVFDPLFEGKLGGYYMALILAVLFSLIIVLILFNVVIALMSGTVDDISTTGKRCWIGHYASVVAEIELFWCCLSQRLSKNNNPIYVYYNANRETVETHHRKMVKKTKKMKKKLKERYEKPKVFSWDDEE